MKKNYGFINIIGLMRTSLIAVSLLLTSSIFKIDKSDSTLGYTSEYRVGMVWIGGETGGGSTTTTTPKVDATAGVGAKVLPVKLPDTYIDSTTGLEMKTGTQIPVNTNTNLTGSPVIYSNNPDKPAYSVYTVPSSSTTTPKTSSVVTSVSNSVQKVVNSINNNAGSTGTSGSISTSSPKTKCVEYKGTCVPSSGYSCVFFNGQLDCPGGTTCGVSCWEDPLTGGISPLTGESSSDKEKSSSEIEVNPTRIKNVKESLDNNTSLNTGANNPNCISLADGSVSCKIYTTPPASPTSLLGSICYAGETTCSGDYLKTCNTTRTGWVSQSCRYGCNNSVKLCNTAPTSSGGTATGTAGVGFTGSKCKSKGASCVVFDISCGAEYGQLDCPSNLKCGLSCVSSKTNIDETTGLPINKIGVQSTQWGSPDDLSIKSAPVTCEGFSGKDLENCEKAVKEGWKGGLLALGIVGGGIVAVNAVPAIVSVASMGGTVGLVQTVLNLPDASTVFVQSTVAASPAIQTTLAIAQLYGAGRSVYDVATMDQEAQNSPYVQGLIGAYLLDPVTFINSLNQSVNTIKRNVVQPVAKNVTQSLESLDLAMEREGTGGSPFTTYGNENYRGPTTVYKGIQNFDEGKGAIVPGGLAETTNTSRAGRTYTVGSGNARVTPNQIVRHSLLGQTGYSGFSSWTPELKTAEMYAGKSGTIVSTVVDSEDAFFLDDLFGADSLIPSDEVYKSAFKLVLEDTTQFVSQGSSKSFDAIYKETMDVMLGNASRIINRSHEVLIPGIVRDFSIVR